MCFPEKTLATPGRAECLAITPQEDGWMRRLSSLGGMHDASWTRSVASGERTERTPPKPSTQGLIGLARADGADVDVVAVADDPHPHWPAKCSVPPRGRKCQ